jgi:hypothetical protein
MQSDADGKIQLVNLVCRTDVLLEYVRKCCGCSQEGTLSKMLHKVTSNHGNRCKHIAVIDLADEVGNPKNLSNSLNSYASDILAARSTFIPVRMDKDHDGQIVYTPLLDNPHFRGKYFV